MGDCVTSEPSDDAHRDITSEETEWIIVKTLLDANARTTQALEHHLLRTYYQQCAPDLEVMRTCVGEALREHERIVENLQLALEALAELEVDE